MEKQFFLQVLALGISATTGWVIVCMNDGR